MALTLAQAYSQGKTLVFGHRGASAYAPMNTLPAFSLALAQGAAGVELDVRLTSDGEMMILHDATVDHTTNGTGSIGDLSFAQVRELDAGAWFGEQY
jgi:glycerophosphoryl diester phosphodiesterase